VHGVPKLPGVPKVAEEITIFKSVNLFKPDPVAMKTIHEP
jgi:hypothetical protein